MLGRQTLNLIPLLALAACAFEAPLGSVAPEPEPVVALEEPTAVERLGRGLQLALDTEESEVEIGVGLTQAKDKRVRIRPVVGEIALRLKSAVDLRSTGIVVEADDIIISPEAFPPSGLHLTNLRGRFDFDEINTNPIDPKRATIDALGHVVIEWSLVRGDRTLDIRPLEIDAKVNGELTIDEDDRLHLSLRGDAPGELLDIVGTKIGDLSIDLSFIE